jgi:hypothetical protein
MKSYKCTWCGCVCVEMGEELRPMWLKIESHGAGDNPMGKATCGILYNTNKHEQNAVFHTSYTCISASYYVDVRNGTST